MNKITRSNGRTYTVKENNNRFFFPNEYMKFADNLKPKQKHSVKVQINTGARIMELQHIKVEDIFIDQRRLVLKVTKTKAKKGEKRGKQRIIPISSKFARYLDRYIKENNLRPEDKIRILSTPALNQGIKKAVQKAGIQDYQNFSSHSLRKTLECWLMSLGTQDSSLLAHFGHDMKTAMSAYVSPDIFSFEEKKLMRLIIGDLYER